MINSTNLEKALKVRYRQDWIGKLAFNERDRPLISKLLKKNTGMVGERTDVFVYIDNAAGGFSSDYATAVSNVSGVQVGKFECTTVEYNQVVEITRKAMLQGRSDAGSFLKNQFLKIDNGFENLANMIERTLFLDGTAKLGEVSSPGASTTLTLSNPEDARNFSKGNVLVFAQDTSSALRDSGATLEVTAVDFYNGTLTVDANVNTISGISDGDAIFIEGTYASASDVNFVSGFDRWLTGSSTIFNQDRSEHSRLQGIATTGSLGDIQKALTDTSATVAKYGSGATRYYVCDWDVFARAVDQLSADRVRNSAGTAEIGYDYIKVFGAGGGSGQLIGHKHCPRNKVYCLDPDSWELGSMGNLMDLNTDDGQTAERTSSQAGLRVHMDSHLQLLCNAPSKNSILTLS